MPSMPPPMLVSRIAARFLLLSLLLPGIAGAQGGSTGAIAGRMIDDRGVAVPDAAVTLSRDGVVIRIVATEPDGRFTLPGLSPGRYAVLLEQVGYQPLRLLGVPVVAGEEQPVLATVTRRPPPVTSVEERRFQGAPVAGVGRVTEGATTSALAERAHAIDLTESVSFFAGPGDAREQALLTANGLPPAQARLIVDGVEQVLLRHPGMPGEGGTAPLFTRNGVAQFRGRPFALDAAQPAAPGGLVELTSRSGSPGTVISPYGSWSGATVGASADDNPADSSASSLQGGLVASGSSRGDSLGWALQLDYRQLATPAAAPFTREAASAALISGADPRVVDSWAAPTVRRWTGGSGSGTIRLPLGARGRLDARLGLASWEEENPLVGQSLANGAGGLLEARDLAGAVTAEFWGEDWRSITRVGVHDVSREWTAVGLPYTTVADVGAALGVQPALPGDFSERLIVLGETVVAPTGEHVLSAGGTVGLRTATYDWLPLGRGQAAFGSTDDFATRSGTWASALASGAAPELSMTEFAVFLQDDWRASRTLQVQFGFRFEAQSLPSDAVSADAEVALAFGLVNSFVPNDKSSGIAPRLGFRWDPSGNGRTFVHAAAGLAPGRYDLVALAEAARHDGDVEVTRAAGTFGWPDAPANPVRAKAITFFDTDVRAPRAIHVSGGLTHAVAPGTVLGITGGFHHTDYLLRRDDVNRPPSPLAVTADDRPVWGELTQLGGLIVPVPGTNQRVAGFDHVWGLTSTGYAEQQFVTMAVERQVMAGLSLSAGYTWSRTEDNLPGQLSALPADRAIVLAADGDTWSEGRSDLDIPHRVSLVAHYRPAGSSGLTATARWRMRSGLPYTPGFPPGVDINGDGSSANDPVSLRSVDGIAGLLSGAGCDPGNGAFAERNSCREDAVHALDLGVGVLLPIGGGRGVRLSVEAFNVVASATGVIDRAAVLVDPEGAITTDGEGRLVLPLVRNDHFGELLSRRTAPRTIRFGLSVEH